MKLSDSSLPVCGKLNDAGTITSVSRPGSSCRGSRRSSSRRLASRQPRQHDEQVAGDRRGEQRVLRFAQHVAGANRRQRRHQPGQHPEADQQRHRDVGDEINLQASQLLEIERAGGVRGDREQAVRRQAGHEARRPRDRRARDVQHVEQALAMVDADQRAAEHDREQHHRRHDVVGQRMERIRRSRRATGNRTPAGARPGSS